MPGGCILKLNLALYEANIITEPVLVALYTLDISFNVRSRPITTIIWHQSLALSRVCFLFCVCELHGQTKLWKLVPVTFCKMVKIVEQQDSWLILSVRHLLLESTSFNLIAVHHPLNSTRATGPNQVFIMWKPDFVIDICYRILIRSQNIIYCYQSCCNKCFPISDGCWWQHTTSRIRTEESSRPRWWTVCV